MLAWIIVIVLLLLLLILPVGVDADYDGARFLLRLKIGPFRKLLFPPPEKKPKAKKEKKEKAERVRYPKGYHAPRRLSREDILTLVRIGLRALKRFRKHLSIDLLRLHFTAAAADPCDAVLLYGWVNAGLATLSPLARPVLHIREGEVETAVDLEGETPRVTLRLIATLQIWEILFIAVCAGGALLVWLGRKKKQARAAAGSSEQKGSD